MCRDTRMMASLLPTYLSSRSSFSRPANMFFSPFPIAFVQIMANFPVVPVLSVKVINPFG